MPACLSVCLSELSSTEKLASSSPLFPCDRPSRRRRRFHVRTLPNGRRRNTSPAAAAARRPPSMAEGALMVGEPAGKWKGLSHLYVRSKYAPFDLKVWCSGMAITIDNVPEQLFRKKIIITQEFKFYYIGMLIFQYDGRCWRRQYTQPLQHFMFHLGKKSRRIFSWDDLGCSTLLSGHSIQTGQAYWKGILKNSIVIMPFHYDCPV